MSAFRRILLVALCAGLVSGIVAAVAQHIGTVPLLLQAEEYEQAAEQKTAAAQSSTAHSPTFGAHHHGPAGEWAPEDGIERVAYTVAADLLAGIGFALLLAAAITLYGREITWREGLFWGLAGFVTFTLAPGLGLPPDMPGNDAGPLLARQLWWAATAAATGGGLALLLFTRRPFYAVLAAVLILLPHLYGAPQPPVGAATATPEALVHRFAIAVTVVSFVFWATLGTATGYFYRRFAPRSA
jgi:cobalt transporter subunit CbtA